MARRRFLIVVFVLFTSMSAPAPARPLQDAGSTQAATEALYRRDCAICHRANGDGKSDLVREEQLTLSDWSDPKSLSGRTDEQLFSIIRAGRGRMPSESAGRASNDQVHALIQYIRTLANAQPGASPAASAPQAPKQ